MFLIVIIVISVSLIRSGNRSAGLKSGGASRSVHQLLFDIKIPVISLRDSRRQHVTWGLRFATEGNV